MSSLLVANWKENGTTDQAAQWVNFLAKEKSNLSSNTVIVCPPFTSLPTTARLIKESGLTIQIGAQNLSRFEEGKSTGEVSAAMIAEFASYVIIGHSERRAAFGEDDEIIADKAKLARKYNLIPIVCISGMKQVTALKNLVSDFDGIIAYEPIFAIGSGNPDTPENANGMAQRIKELLPNNKVIYGGSVDSANVKTFLSQSNISGVLVGNRSLDSSFFLEIIKNAH